MTEIVLNVDDQLASRFKDISSKKFQGDDKLAFEYAVNSLLSEDELDMLRLEQVFEQIQKDIESAGGMSDEEIDALIANYRRQKRIRGKFVESGH